MGVSLSSFFSVNGFEWHVDDVQVHGSTLGQGLRPRSGRNPTAATNLQPGALSLVTSYSSSVATGHDLFIPITHWSLQG